MQILHEEGEMETDQMIRESGLAFWEGEQDNPWSVAQAVNVSLSGTVGTNCYDRLEFLLRAVTLDKFILSVNMVRGWSAVRDFFGIVKDVYEDRQWWTWDGDESPWKDPRVVEDFMTQCLDIAKRSKVWYPAGWLKVLTEIRAALNDAAYQQERDPTTGKVLVRVQRPSRRHAARS